jgi:hypothetical protein
MTNKCPECGATHSDVTSCQTMFDSFLVLEYTIPDYGIVHPLTVGSYFIQHRLYSQEALIWIEHILCDSLKFGLPSRYMLQNMRSTAESHKRSWKLMRPLNAPAQAKIAWSMTIADVATNYHDAGSYCELVKMWAHTTFYEMKPLLPPL